MQLLGASLTLLVRALPLLLFFSLVTFFTNEYWQLFGEASDVTFYAAAGLFALITAVFLIVRPRAASATSSGAARSRSRFAGGNA